MRKPEQLLNESSIISISEGDIPALILKDMKLKSAFPPLFLSARGISLGLAVSAPKYFA